MAFLKKVTVLCVILILLLVFLTSCSFTKRIDKRASPQLGGFLGGDNALIIRIIEGAPPTVIQDRSLSNFSFFITLENAGETKIGKGTENPLIIARLVGILNKDFGLTEESAAKRVDVPLENARRNMDGTITPGEITDVSFEGLSYKQGIAESMALTFRAEICYDYESLATTKFCMKKDSIESIEDASICMLKGPRGVGNSGAPLHVTSVEEAPLAPNKIQLNLRIEHVGRGMFFFRNEPKDNYDACVFSDLNPNIYKVEIFVEPVQKDSYSVECLRLDEPIQGGGVKGTIRMQNGAPLSLSCFVTRTKENSQRVYEDLLNIKLKYRYGEFVEVPILIQSHP